jgi:hypothetical protein
MALLLAVALATGLLLAPATASATTIPLKESGYPSPMREPMDQAGEPDTPWGRDLFNGQHWVPQDILEAAYTILLARAISFRLLTTRGEAGANPEAHVSR